MNNKRQEKTRHNVHANDGEAKRQDKEKQQQQEEEEERERKKKGRIMQVHHMHWSFLCRECHVIKNKFSK